jgi:reactive intermediate/imine deaminase
MGESKSEIRKLIPKSSRPPAGAFSHGVLVPLPGADLLFVTGQVAVDKEGKLVGENDPKAQAEFVFENVGRILEEANLSFRDVVKAQIFLTQIKDFPVVSEVRNRYFAESKPASTLVEVSRLVREGCCVEVEVIALRLH